MKRWRSYGFLFIVTIILASQYGWAVSCQFDDLMREGARYQQRFYEGYIEEALQGWKNYARRTKCPLAQAYYLNTLFWTMLHRQSHDEDIRSLEEKFFKVAHIIITPPSSRYQEIPQELAFARAWAYILLAQWAGMNGKWTRLPGLLKKGLKWLDEAERMGGDRPEIMYYRGLSLYLLDQKGFLFRILGFFVGLPRGNRARGLALLQKAVQKPSLLREDMMLVLAALYQKEKKFLKALEGIHELRTLHPNNPVYHFWEGLFYERTAYDYVKALSIYRAIYERALRGDDKRYDSIIRVVARYRVGFMFYKLYHYRRAHEWFQPILEQKPKTPPWVYPKTCLVLGDLYRSLGEIERAMEFYKKVLSFPSPSLYRKRALQNLRRDLKPPPQNERLYTRLRMKIQNGEGSEVCHDAYMRQFSRAEWRLLARFECRFWNDPDTLPGLMMHFRKTHMSWKTFIPYRIYMILGLYYGQQGEREVALKMYRRMYQNPLAPDEYRSFALFRVKSMEKHTSSAKKGIARRKRK